MRLLHKCRIHPKVARAQRVHLEWRIAEDKILNPEFQVRLSPRCGLTVKMRFYKVF